MIYELAHIVQNKMPWVWDLVEWMNSVLFTARYGNKVVCQEVTQDGLTVRLVKKEDAKALAAFFAEQPEECYRWFKPHEFDEKTLVKLIERKSFVMYLVWGDGRVVGYGFVRCFFMGKGFLGKMVDYRCGGKGIATLIVKTGMDICLRAGIRMFESINKDNVASMRCSQKACKVVVVEELEDGDVLVEDFPKES